MFIKSTLFTSLLLGGGAFAFTFGPEQVGENQAGEPRRAEVESVQLGLKLEKDAKFRFEITETHPAPGRGHEERPGTEGHGGAQQPGSGQQPGVGATDPTTLPGFESPSTVLNYEVNVRETGENDLITLEVKKSHKSKAGRAAGEDPWKESEQPGHADKARERTYIVRVTKTGEIRDIRPEGDEPMGDERDEGQRGFGEGQGGFGEDQQDFGGDVRTMEQQSVRDHLHALLGTGLHERELRQGEVVHLGHPTPATGMPIEAGARDGQKERDKGSPPHGMAKGHQLKLTGMALELRAVETRGEVRLARFRILDESSPMLPGRRSGLGDEREQDRGFGDARDQEDTGIGQEPVVQDESRTAGLAAFRVGDGLLEELTYLERIGEQPRHEPGRPGLERREEGQGFGDEPGVGEQDRDRDVGRATMPRMRSISIRRLEG